MTKEIKCPICDTKMNGTANNNLYLCPEKRKIYLPYFRESISYYDCALEIHADGGYTFQQYEMPPYKVVIRSPKIYTNEWGTHVMVIKDIKYDEHLGMPEPFITWKEAFQTDSILELPWRDLDKCVQKLRLLTTFS